MSRTKCFWLEKDGNKWKRTDTGEVFESPTVAPVGALYHSPDTLAMHMANATGLFVKSYGDGLFIVATTPSGPWCIDGPSFDGTAYHACPWARTGDPRNPASFSVHPSIDFTGKGKYPNEFHGWLTNGELYPA